jgi:VCBS repeat protein
MLLIHWNLDGSARDRRESAARPIRSLRAHARRSGLSLAACAVLCLLVSSREGRAAGWDGFEPPVSFAMGAPVVCLASHTTADGHALVVGTNGLGATVFRGFDNGEFQQRRDIPGGFVVSVAMDDLNEDATPDLVVPNYFGASFTIYLGAPDGSFTPGETYSVEGHCTWVATGDFNEDGRVDIAAARNGSGEPVNLYVYLGNGDGTFARFRTYPTQLATPTEIILANVDADGHRDIAYSLSGPSTGALFRGNGDGTFGAPMLIEEGTDLSGNSQGFSLADLDGDGNLDWIAAQDFIDSIVVRKGDGTGRFVSGAGLSLPHPWDIETADLDGNGTPDLIASNLDSAVCYLQDPNGVFSPASTVHSPGGLVHLMARDLDGDGFPDLVFSGLDNSFSVAINRGHATTTVDPPPVEAALLPNYPNPVDLATVFKYRVSQQGGVRLILYDLLGRKIATLVDGTSEPGTHAVPFDASHLAAGAYFYRLYTRDAVLGGKMTVLR